jgi:alcohol dehydrogenase class IV
MSDILEALGGNSSFLSEEEASIKCVELLEQLVSDVGIPSTLGGFDIPESALEQLTEDGLKQKRLLARSPLPLHESDIRAIYQAAFKGERVEP